jgi:F420-0:gamma-glutamyl ligase
MIVTAIPTRRVAPGSETNEVLDESLLSLPERAIVVVTSKIVAICEGRTVKVSDGKSKRSLVELESDYFLPEHYDHMGLGLTIIHSSLIPAAGIDESNGDGDFVLWPINPLQSARNIRNYLRTQHNVDELGVILSDSTARPLHFGTEGIGIAFSGFLPLKSYSGLADLYGRPLYHTAANIVDGLASAAVLVMGEGAEQTPLALIEDVPFVTFIEEDRTINTSEFFIPHIEDDLFAALLRNAPWIRGGRGA